MTSYLAVQRSLAQVTEKPSSALTMAVRSDNATRQKSPFLQALDLTLH